MVMVEETFSGLVDLRIRLVFGAFAPDIRELTLLDATVVNVSLLIVRCKYLM